MEPFLSEQVDSGEDNLFPAFLDEFGVFDGCVNSAQVLVPNNIITEQSLTFRAPVHINLVRSTLSTQNTINHQNYRARQFPSPPTTLTM